MAQCDIILHYVILYQCNTNWWGPSDKTPNSQLGIIIHLCFILETINNRQRLPMGSL